MDKQPIKIFLLGRAKSGRRSLIRIFLNYTFVSSYKTNPPNFPRYFIMGKDKKLLLQVFSGYDILIKC